MKTITWLASYPKSGNTWLRSLWSSYLRNGAAVDINQLLVGSAADLARLDRFGALDVSKLTSDQATELRPALYLALSESVTPPFLLKVHDVFGDTPGGKRVFPAAATHAAVYAVRHPCAVAVSLAFHLRLTLAESVDMMCADSWLRQADAFRQRLGTWSMNVLSWVDQQDFPVHVVRYEDLVREPAATFTRLLSSVGVQTDADLVHRAVHETTFATLQAKEAATGFAERSASATAPFFREGTSSGWQKHLPRDLSMRVADTHHQVMARFGYRVDDQGGAEAQEGAEVTR